MKRSFDNFAIVDDGLANNRNSVPYLNISGDPFGTPVVGGINTTPNTSWTTTAPSYSTPPPTYYGGQTTQSGGFLSGFDAEQLNSLGQTLGSITSAIFAIRQQSQQAQTQEEQLELQRQAQELERQRIEAMNNLAEAQRRAGVEVTANEGLSTGAIIGIVAGGALVLGLILFLALRQK
jgi:hypothetical protein